jgi:hypothetical protein
MPCLGLIPLVALLVGCDGAGDHPSSAKLLQQWHDHRAELQQLVTDFQKDKALNRVAPDFTRPDDPSTVGVSPARIADYRERLQKAEVSRGIEGYGDKDAITFIVSALGLSVSGSGKGIAYLEGDPEILVPDLDAYVSKALADHSRSFTAYQRLEGNWYLYYDYED